MKAQTFKYFSAAVLLSAILGSAVPALATSTGPQSLGSEATSIDMFVFTCPTTTFGAQANVEDLSNVYNPKARVSVMLNKNGRARQEEDVSPSDRAGEGGGASPNAVLLQKGGSYRMLVFQNARGPESYQASADCNTTEGKVNPILKMKQDQ